MEFSREEASRYSARYLGASRRRRTPRLATDQACCPGSGRIRCVPGQMPLRGRGSHVHEPRPSQRSSSKLQVSSRASLRPMRHLGSHSRPPGPRCCWAVESCRLIQLNPRLVTLRAIAAGRYDRYLSQFAAAVRATGAPVGLSFGHEMNGSWYSWGYHHVLPQVFVAAWRHIHQVFAAVGARKVIWVWTVIHIRDIPGDWKVAQDPRPWWPGRAYVNWVGLDIYYFSPAVTFQWKFVPTITAVRSFTDDPILLTETAVPNQSGQVHQIANLFAGARASHLMGIIWYNQAGRHAWQLDKSRRAAITAFHRAATRMVASR